MNEKETPQEPELSTEERFKQTVEKLRPYIHKLWNERRKLLWINFSVAVVTILILLFLVKPYYDSQVTILPDYGANASSMLGQLSGLASLAGVNVGASTPSQIYEELITSEAVLSPVIYAKYKTEEFPDSVNLIQYDEIDPDESLTPDLQKRKMFLKEFGKLVGDKEYLRVDRLSQILTVKVSMPEGQLSADVQIILQNHLIIIYRHR